MIDLTAVTFVCSTFANFLAALHRTHPDAELVLHHPSRMARLIITATGLGEFVSMSGAPVTVPGAESRRSLDWTRTRRASA